MADADVDHQGLEEFKIEDVMVQAAVLEVVQRSFPELVEGAGGSVPTEIMLFEDLRQMSEIVFTNTPGMVLHEVLQGRRLTPMVECEPLVGQDEQQDTSFADDPFPLEQCLDRIGTMLETV